MKRGLVQGGRPSGLAKRKDARALEPLRRRLETSTLDMPFIEAAEQLQDASLVPELVTLRDRVQDAIRTLTGNEAPESERTE